MKKYYLLIIGALFLNGCNKNDIKSITCNDENATELLTQLQEEFINEPFSNLSKDKEIAKAQLKSALFELAFKQGVLFQELEAAMTQQKKQSKFSDLFIEKKMKTKIIYDNFRTDKLDEKAQKRFCIATMKEGSIISLGNIAFKVPQPKDIYYSIQLTDDKKQIYVELFNEE